MNTKQITQTIILLILIVVAGCGWPPVELPAADTPHQQPFVWPPLAEGVKVDVAGMLDVNYYILLDTSGSMEGSNIRTAKKAISEFVNAIPEKANIGLGYFGGDYGELVHIGQDRQKILSEVYDLDTGSGTPMAHAIHEVA